MSDLELAIDFQIKAVGLPEPEKQYFFHPTRRWRFDRAWPQEAVALEVEGGASFRPVYSPKGKKVIGHHVHPKGFQEDCHKYNEAALLGWRVLRVTGDMIKKGEALQFIERALGVK